MGECNTNVLVGIFQIKFRGLVAYLNSPLLLFSYFSYLATLQDKIIMSLRHSSKQKSMTSFKTFKIFPKLVLILLLKLVKEFRRNVLQNWRLVLHNILNNRRIYTYFNSVSLFQVKLVTGNSTGCSAWHLCISQSSNLKAVCLTEHVLQTAHSTVGDSRGYKWTTHNK